MNAMPWPYKHGRTGTCVEECLMYSKCHCGCGKPTAISTKSRSNEGRVRGQPRVWLFGHAAAKAKTGKPMGEAVSKCHPDRKHKGRGLCGPCYDRGLRDGTIVPGEGRQKLQTPERLQWEALRYKRCLELLWEHGYGQIKVVLEQLDEELPEMEVA